MVVTMVKLDEAKMQISNISWISHGKVEPHNCKSVCWSILAPNTHSISHSTANFLISLYSQHAKSLQIYGFKNV